MKKFLIAVLFIIPILVVFAIEWTGDAITALGSIPNPERIEIKNSDGDVLHNKNVIFNRYDSDGNDGEFILYISVYPTISDNAIGWNLVEGESYDGKCRLEYVEGTKYKLVAEINGSVLMKIYPKANVNAAESLNIYITSDSITSLKINDADGNKYNNEDKLYLNGVTAMKLYAEAYPAEAIGDNVITWSSYDSDIISVDRNGYIKVKKEGRTNIYAEVMGRDGKSKRTYVQVVTSAENEVWLMKETEVECIKNHWETLTTEERINWIIRNVALKSGDADEVSEEIEGDVYTYRMNGKELKVVAIEDNNAIKFASDYMTDVYIENGGYHLEVAFSDYERNGEIPQNIRYEVSDAAVLSIKEGRIIPKTEGVCVVKAIYPYTIAGESKEATATITLTVRKRITAFDLILNAADNQRGVMQKRAWGINWKNSNGEIVNTYRMSYKIESVYPDTNNELQLKWEISDPTLATVSKNGEITFLTEALGKKVTVSATLLVHNIPTSLKRSYTFSILKEADALNVYSEADFFNAQTVEGGQRPVALQSSLILERSGNSPREIDYFSNSIYGNGFMFDYSYPDVTLKENEQFERDVLNITDESIKPGITEVVIENLYMRSGENYEKGKSKGTLLTVKRLPKEVNVKIRNCVILYCNSCMCLYNNFGTITVEGCILGEASLSAVILMNSFEDKGQTERGTIVLRNMVFRKTVNCSIVFTPGGSTAEEGKELNYVPNVRIEGFIDSYNWKKTNELSVLFTSMSNSNMGVFAESRDAIDRILGSVLATHYRDHYQNSIYRCPDENGVTSDYIATTMLALGIYARVNPERFDLSKAEGLELMEFNTQEVTKLFQRVLGNMDLSGSCYLLDYKLEEHVDQNGNVTYAPRIKPNDPCPENEAMYDRLRLDSEDY